MPSCLVNKCTSSTGRKAQDPDIKFHKFPKEAQRLRIWLEQTGQTFTNLEGLVEKIQEGYKQNKYYICSQHFSKDSYYDTPKGPALTPYAMPSIFPAIKEGEYLIEESLKKKRYYPPQRKKRTSRSGLNVESTATSSDNMTLDTDTTPEFEILIPQFRSVATQTDFTLTNSKVGFLETKEVTRELLEASENQYFCQISPCVSTPIEKTGKITLLDSREFSSPLCNRAHVKTVLFIKSEHENS